MVGFAEQAEAAAPSAGEPKPEQHDSAPVEQSGHVDYRHDSCDAAASGHFGTWIVECPLGASVLESAAAIADSGHLSLVLPPCEENHGGPVPSVQPSSLGEVGKIAQTRLLLPLQPLV